MKQYLDTIEQLGSLKSRKDKIVLLKTALIDETFRKIVKYALDPFITFGITDYIIEPEAIYSIPRKDFFEFLDDLAERRLTGYAARTMAGQHAVLGEFYLEDILKLILAKDLRCGVGVKTVNAAYPNLIKEFKVTAAEL